MNDKKEDMKPTIKSNKNIFEIASNLAAQIKSEGKHKESYGTGLVGEHMIISAYKTMTIKDLEKVRFIVSEIIRRKKEIERIKNNAGVVEQEINKQLPKK